MRLQRECREKIQALSESINNNLDETLNTDRKIDNEIIMINRFSFSSNASTTTKEQNNATPTSISEPTKGRRRFSDLFRSKSVYGKERCASMEPLHNEVINNGSSLEVNSVPSTSTFTGNTQSIRRRTSIMENVKKFVRKASLKLSRHPYSNATLNSASETDSINYSPSQSARKRPQYKIVSQMYAMENFKRSSSSSLALESPSPTLQQQPIINDTKELEQEEKLDILLGKQQERVEDAKDSVVNHFIISSSVQCALLHSDEQIYPGELSFTTLMLQFTLIDTKLLLDSTCAKLPDNPEIFFQIPLIKIVAIIPASRYGAPSIYIATQVRMIKFINVVGRDAFLRPLCEVWMNQCRSMVSFEPASLVKNRRASTLWIEGTLRNDADSNKNNDISSSKTIPQTKVFSMPKTIQPESYHNCLCTCHYNMAIIEDILDAPPISLARFMFGIKAKFSKKNFSKETPKDNGVLKRFQFFPFDDALSFVTQWNIGGGVYKNHHMSNISRRRLEYIISYNGSRWNVNEQQLILAETADCFIAESIIKVDGFPHNRLRLRWCITLCPKPRRNLNSRISITAGVENAKVSENDGDYQEYMTRWNSFMEAFKHKNIKAKVENIKKHLHPKTFILSKKVSSSENLFFFTFLFNIRLSYHLCLAWIFAMIDTDAAKGWIIQKGFAFVAATIIVYGLTYIMNE